MWRSLLILPFVALAVVAGASISIDPRCTRYSQGMTAQLYAHLQDCRKFVMCDMGGNGRVMACPPGLYFDNAEHACSFETVGCTHGELEENPGPVPVPQLPSVPYAPPKPVPVPLPAPVFVPSIPVIVPPVVLEPPKPGVSESLQHLQRQCWGQPSGDVFSVMEDCGLYVVCLGNNNAIVSRCPKGLLFDSKRLSCEFSESAICSTPRADETEDAKPYAMPDADLAEEVPQPLVVVPEAVEPQKPVAPVAPEYALRILENYPPCLARGDLSTTAELPHAADCSLYLVCVGRVAIEKRCPGGQHWNADRGWCDFAAQAGCKL
ncbi:uncharacterized protein LOC128278394 [Anopheles cruzii]|uniref:uncharacterized protein LOC128278394 n=1 Tax=Anopheles cruzii TaxID=68878 RepID=UPI0022EC5C18|nr:uncharacterized protein LOC128278394 [Anopheles cruzii]